MRKPFPRDCIDEHDEFDAECFAEALDRYNDERKDDLLEQSILEQEKKDAEQNKRRTLQRNDGNGDRKNGT